MPELGTNVSFKVNGNDISGGVKSHFLLLSESTPSLHYRLVQPRDVGSTLSLARYLREHLHLTGTKVSCGMGGCGACTVEAAFREDGKRVVRSVNACLVPVLSCDEWEITTVEGIGSLRTGLSDVQSRDAIQ